jgi:glycosyltransferase involved in cell wall biosynthesis
MKKLLVITYYWPPSGGAGVQRWLKFVKYLAQMGWEIHVITVDDAVATYPHRDSSLPTTIEGNVTVYRTSTSEPYRYYSMLSGGKVPSAGFANESTGNSVGLLKRLARFVRGNVFIPDPRKGWNSYAIKKAKEIIDANGIQVVVTTSPPHSTQLIGLELKKCRDIKWIADMRDPWTGIYYASELLQTAWAERQNAKMEREVLLTADHIITVSNQLKRDFMKLVPDLSANGISVIPNGYDPDDFTDNQPVDNAFTIGYMGTITAQYDITALVSVLKIWSEKLDYALLGKFLWIFNFL